MRKLTKAEKARAFDEAIERLQREGFHIKPQRDSLSLIAMNPQGESFFILPVARRWKRKGAKGKAQCGGVEEFLRHFNQSQAVRRMDAAEWDLLRPEVTLFTDASLCPRTGASGWGAWVISNDRASESFGGEIKDLLKSSSEAEIRAGANAFFVAVERGFIQRGAVVMWQCDNTTALRWLLALHPNSRDRASRDGLAVSPPTARGIKKQDSAGARELAKICERLELRILVRHVKAHKEGPSRQWVNRLCDEIAGEQMRARRDKIPGAPKPPARSRLAGSPGANHAPT